MPRTYFKGKIVGEVDPPVSLLDWVRGELQHTQQMDPHPYVRGRARVLEEMLMRMET